MARVAAKTSHAIPRELRGIARSVIEARLPNGLGIRLLPNHAVPTISYYTFFKVGSRNERPGITGISHLFEHMMFNGAKKYGPGEFDQMLESNGGTSNAYTSTDVTVYYEDCMAEALPLVVDLEVDRMKSLSVTPRLLESERKVVLEERRLRVDNEIGGMLDEELSSLIWKAHPYRWPVIGWQADIESISREACLDYFRTFYAPNNATLVVAGDFDPQDTLALLKKAYGPLRAGPRAPAVLDAEPEQRGERRAEVRYPAQAPSLMIAWRGPRATDADTLALDVLQYALSVGQSSRLMKALVFEREVAVSVGVDWSWRMDPGAFTVVLELKPEADPRETERALYDELEKVARDGLTPAELEKALNNLSTQHLRELATNSGRAHTLGTYELMLGDWRRAFTLGAGWEAVTLEKVKEVARKYLAPARRNVATLVPTPEASA